MRLLVTARATGPMCESVTSQAAASARPIIVGPERVPPGRSCAASYGTRMRTPSAAGVLDPVGARRARERVAEELVELVDGHGQRGHAAEPIGRRSRRAALR